ncbi:MAG TPA: hypothetical protein VLD37_02315 [Candidatus Bilamarchaeum sp.]|nr:hypothetical protein [Candidatus Bilamarchaeum sp.]
MTSYPVVFVFPVLVFALGAYLVFRGASKPEPKSVSGTARCANPLKSPVSGRSAAYFRLVIEAYRGGHAEWKEIYRAESNSPFTLSGRPVSLEYADIRISKPAVFEGHSKADFIKGDIALFGSVFGQFQNNITTALAASFVIARAIGFLPTGTQFLDEPILQGLLADPAIKKALRPHLGKYLRVSEYSIEDGSRITAVSGSGELRGSLERPLLITDGSQDEALSTIEEKAKTSILLGAGLLTFSFVISLLLLLS